MDSKARHLVPFILVGYILTETGNVNRRSTFWMYVLKVSFLLYVFYEVMSFILSLTASLTHRIHFTASGWG